MIGKRISGRYEVLGTIGGGGMANVYQANDIILDRMVAVKVLQPQFSDDEEFIKRFRREAQAATSLDHPNVVTIYDVGQDNGIYYIVMEYVVGSTLKEVIREQGVLPVDRALKVMKQVASAIAHAHANQIIHRDIKPHNILIGSDGIAKVTDFGIARAISSATITHTNSVMGSVHYLSPEQARGGVVNAKSDIYSLGIVLYEMIVGQVPFSGDTAVSIAIKHLQHDIPSVRRVNPTIPQSVENMILRATVKDPLQRYDSVLEMERDVATALEPSRIDERKFVPVGDDDEVTKAIPVIKESAMKNQAVEDKVGFSATKQEKSKEELPSSPVKTKAGRAKKVLLWLVVLLALFVGSAIATFVLYPKLFMPNEVGIPDVREVHIDEAEQQLSNLGLKLEREDVWNEEVPESYVFEQEPAAGRMVKEGSTIMLTVSKGRKTVKMIHLVDKTGDTARRQLLNFGFRMEDIVVEEREDRDQIPGVVVDQEPDPGESIILDETTVVLWMSVMPNVTLENLRGFSEEEALAYLGAHSLHVGDYLYEHNDDVTAGNVIRSSPPAYDDVREGTQVDLTFSQGPKEVPKEAREILVPISIDLPSDEEEQAFHIEIVYEDATTAGPTIFKKEAITESTSYDLILEVTPEISGSYMLDVNGDMIDSRTISYDYEQE